LIIKKKTRMQLIHGESATEALPATMDVGAFEHEHDRPDCAVPNLNKASLNAKQTKPQQEDVFIHIVERVDAKLNATAPNQLDKAEGLAVGEAILLRMLNVNQRTN
jgi:hypothetical protein